MRRDAIKIGAALVGLLGLMTWGALGCGTPPGSLADAAVAMDGQPDVIPAPDPLRRLQTRRMFGEAPVLNRVFDPEWKVVDGLIWSPFNPFSYDVAQYTRLHLRTPLGQPALRLEPPAGAVSGQIAGLAKGASGPMQVSVWFGRFEGNNVVSVSAAVYGLFEDSSGAVVLEPDPFQDPVVLDGITWVRYVAYMDNGPVAWMQLRLSNDNVAPAFISSPVVVRAPLQPPAAQSLRRPGVRRPLLPVERASIRDFLRRSGERFGGPPRQGPRAP